MREGFAPPLAVLETAVLLLTLTHREKRKKRRDSPANLRVEFRADYCVYVNRAVL